MRQQSPDGAQQKVTPPKPPGPDLASLAQAGEIRVQIAAEVLGPGKRDKQNNDWLGCWRSPRLRRLRHSFSSATMLQLPERWSRESLLSRERVHIRGDLKRGFGLAAISFLGPIDQDEVGSCAATRALKNWISATKAWWEEDQLTKDQPSHFRHRIFCVHRLW